MNPTPIRIGIQQRVLPAYRADFFDLLAEAYQGAVSVFSGEARADEALGELAVLKTASQTQAENQHLFQGAAYLCNQRGMHQWLQAWNPDVLILEANPRYLSTSPAIAWMHRRRRPVIGWGLGAPVNNNMRAALMKRFWKIFIKQFDYLITYSEQGKKEYQALGIDENRIFVAPNSVARKPLYPLPFRDETTYRDEKPTLLFVGRLQARKRLEYLFQACADLPEALQPHIWIVGDGQEREYFEVLASALYADVTFHGALFGMDLDPLFKQADLFVLPGTGGLAVQQAMSFGLPVMVGQADGTQSVLVRENNGWIIPPDADEKVFAAMLKEALSNPQRLREMGRESFRIVQEEVNVERMVAVFEQAISTACVKKS
jgi:glycosyltransferase involved in cell wall biosynthesis